ncbi:hypothetical protein [Phycisphaera mikurensis]|uniref:Uncharacterized protein n=1 Tax=Phycisphaera mikurensis (strain NBRC 102666 / KCTC 22515 / FYK2301M01) TaxID=1142394 RepID=I0ID24_PHYMF|nr:hypothetical protein [Phycisphaera mikurensis]MBB6442287.1 hypothetical protein [Phycisphaera mikurensis]BAM03162.1 hypothetical protein PSMK_10030 [Phycisphaera mikurensis NBRC 102666]
MRSPVPEAVLAVAATLAITPASAESVEFSLPGGVATSAIGQAFVPAEALPDLPGDATLASVAFVAGGPGGASGFDRTKLAIFPAAYPRFTNSLRRDATLAVSTNFVDTANAAPGSTLRFNFKNLQLPPAEAVAAVLVTIDEFGRLQPTPASVRFVRFEGFGDAAAPVANPGGVGNFDFAALYPDDDGDGYPQGAVDGADLSFTLTFDLPDAAAPAEPE